MHDAGVDQALIDTLPVFLYGTIRGLKDGADCAVCLSEFGDADRLRLLPKCKHAFHHDCIDTWLLANSTCPLCRQSLLNPADGDSLRLTAFGSNNNPGAAAAAERQLQQLADDSRARACNPDAAPENVTEQLQELAVAAGAPTDHSEPRQQPSSMLQGSPLGAGPTVCVTEADGTERVTRVQLGKVKFDSSVAAEDYDDNNNNNNSGNEGFELQQQLGCSAISSCSGSAAAAATGRCYSMGSYQYIVDSTSFELTMAPTPYPGRPQLWGSAATPAHLLQRHTLHRSVLSDTIPELAAPANEDFFWASRGLNTPKSLSLVREMMSPSTESFLFSPALAASAAEPDHGFLHRRSSLLQPAMKDHPQQQQQQQCHDAKLMEDDHQLMPGSKLLEDSDQVTLVIRTWSCSGLLIMEIIKISLPVWAALLLRSWIKESSSCSCHVSEQLESSIKEKQQITTTTTTNSSSEAQRQIKEQEQEQITTIVTTTIPSSQELFFRRQKNSKKQSKVILEALSLSHKRSRIMIQG
jgi:hypothetical protein